VPDMALADPRARTDGQRWRRADVHARGKCRRHASRTSDVAFAPPSPLNAHSRPRSLCSSGRPACWSRGPYALRRALHGARPPGLVLVREPDELGLERAPPQLALGARVVALADAHGH